MPFAAAALALAACNAMPKPVQADSRTQASETVEFDIRSWGKLVSHWRIGGDGSGEIWRVADGGTMSQYDIRKFRFHMDDAARAQFRAASGDLKRATRRKVACTLQITDMHYGDFVWSGGAVQQKFNFNYGCRSREMDRVFDLIQRTNEVIENRAAIESQPFTTEHIGTR